MKIMSVFFLSSLFSLVICGCDSSKQTTPDMSGKKLFQVFCSSCHGPKGKGRFLSGIPANNTTKYRINQVEKLIRMGSQGKHAMVAQPEIAPLEALKIARYVVVDLKAEAKKKRE